MRNTAGLAEAIRVVARRGGLHNVTQSDYRGAPGDMRNSTLLILPRALRGRRLGDFCRRAWVESTTDD